MKETKKLNKMIELQIELELRQSDLKYYKERLSFIESDEFKSYEFEEIGEKIRKNEIKHLKSTIKTLENLTKTYIDHIQLLITTADEPFVNQFYYWLIDTNRNCKIYSF